jgi:hypothetical protein
LAAQTPAINFAGAVTVGQPLTVAGTVGDTLSVSFGSASTADCSITFNSLTALNLSAAGAKSIGITASPQSIAIFTPPASFVAGVQVCLRADHTNADGSVTTAYSPSPKALSAAASGVAFLQPPAANANSITVQVSTAPSDLFVYDLPPNYKMSTAAAGNCTTDGMQTLLQLGAAKGTSQHIAAIGPQTIQLSKALSADDQLCVAVVPAAGGAAQFSALTTITPPPAGTIRLLSAVAMNSNSVTFESDTPGALSIYLFGAGYLPQNAGQSICSEADLANGSLLPLVPTSTGSGSGAASTTTSLPVTAKTVTTVALSTPLTANTQICLAETGSSGLPYVAFSQLTPVEFFPPGSDYGRFGLGFTGGVIISNQEQSTASTTASQFLEAELTYDFVRGKAVGLSSFLNFRSSTIPVATTSTNSTPASGSNAAPTLTQSLNALSSQQSVRILAGFLMPFNLTKWYRDQRLTLAPLVVGGFDTLLNPTPPTSTPSTGTTITTTAANFSSVYDYWAGGGELSWVQQPLNNRDESDRTFAWVSATVGNYSSLPSYICTAKAGSTPATSAKYFSDPASPATSCLVSPVPSTGTPTSYQVYASRQLIPRLDIAGNLNLPNLPVVLGFDANLGQFSWRANNLDIMNKPGNDVRLFFGLRFDIIAALGKLGVPTK